MQNMILPLHLYEWKDTFGDEKYFDIRDAENNIIIETDTNYYPPTKDDAEYIIKAVNDYYVRNGRK